MNTQYTLPADRQPARTFRDLAVWRKAHEFVLQVYAFTAGFPRQETYGLASQMRRAAVSIPANIAEGFRRRGKPDKARFMNIGAKPLLISSPSLRARARETGGSSNCTDTGEGRINEETGPESGAATESALRTCTSRIEPETTAIVLQ